MHAKNNHLEEKLLMKKLFKFNSFIWFLTNAGSREGRIFRGSGVALSAARYDGFHIRCGSDLVAAKLHYFVMNIINGVEDPRT